MIRTRKVPDGAGALTFEELDQRWRMGGVLPGIPELTPEQKAHHAALDPGLPMQAPAGLRDDGWGEGRYPKASPLKLFDTDS